MRKKFLEFDQMSTVDATSKYANALIEKEGRVSIEEALRRVEARTGVNYWTLWAFRYRKPKVIAADIFFQIRDSYLALCEREVAKLEHSIAIAKAKGGTDDLEDIAGTAASVRAQLEAAKEGNGG